MGYTNEMFGLTTYLEHGPSQEKVSTWYPLPDPARGQIKPQAFGSSLTYARRYSVSSLVGIASEEDDDGQQAPPNDPPPLKPTTKPVHAKPPVTTPPNQSKPAVPPPPPKKDPAADEFDRLLDQSDFDFPPVDNSGEFVDEQFPEEEPKTLLDRLCELAAQKEIPNEEMRGVIRKVTGTSKLSKDLSSEQLEKVISFIEKFYSKKQ
jgi:hypothetical protein